jgi:cytochrome c oxidase assembly protein subunit 11
MTTQAPKRGMNWTMFGKLAVIVTLMFGFGWALVPLYKAICEVTGINSLTKEDKQAQTFAKNTQVDNTRSITVEFDANSRGPWQFKPEKSSLDVKPGELATMVYTLVNTTENATAGQAIPSYAPKHSGQYFRKLECFCFKQQALGARETKQFPVVFVVDPNLPKDVNTITLSYTFFEVAGLSSAAPAAEPAKPAGAGS